MHSVITHLLARANAKPPFADGKKIALVLFGGVLAGARGAGAMIALSDLGLSQSFNAIYAISAGLPNASYLLAEDTRLGTSIYYDDLSGKQMINPWRFWHIAKVTRVVDVIQNIKPLNVERMLLSKTKLYVGLRNVSDKRNEFHEVHQYSKAEYFQLLHAAIAMPFLSPGNVMIRGKQYMDCHEGGNMMLDKVLKEGFTDVLVLANYASQVPRHFVPPPNMLLLRPLGSKSSDRFITDKEKLKQMAISMGTQLLSEAGLKTTLAL